MKTIWIVKGAVTDPEAHEYQAKIGDTEWQFSDGPPGERSSSADYLNLEDGLRDHAPAVFHFVGDEPETLWCESCGEAPVTQRLEFAGLCDGCAAEAEKEDRALEAHMTLGEQIKAHPEWSERGAAEQMLRARGWSESDVDAAYETHADPDLDPDRWIFVAEAFEAQGPEGNGHDFPSCRACGHPGSDDHEDCPNCAEVPA